MLIKLFPIIYDISYNNKYLYNNIISYKNSLCIDNYSYIYISLYFKES